MPVIVIHGDMDTAVPVTLSRTWVDVMKTLNMPYQYIEVAGGNHGSVISGSMPDIFTFLRQTHEGCPLTLSGDNSEGR